jgi:uroporphyrinogen decarboxylase
MSMVPPEKMTYSARKLRAIYDKTPGAPFLQREFGFYCMERWAEQGLMKEVNLAENFGYDPPGNYSLGQLGWCEAAFVPQFEEKILEDRGEHELVRDFAGRSVLYFKGRRSGFMPEYVDHPVKDMATWKELCEWRMNPKSPERFADLEARMEKAQDAAAKGMIITQNLIGGYMYLRSLMGPEEILYAFYDQPETIHACLETWFQLADTVIARHQEYVTIDELYLAEDICYNKGPLIGPDMMREFLFPYYRRLIKNLRDRQIDKNRFLHIQIDTDGFAVPVIPVYQEIGMTVMSPFEVASNCDVVAIGKQYPDLVLLGGVDKRVLATTPAEIDALVDRIFPAMLARGGFIPTCDHGVPEEVSLANYRHYRKRCLEFAK